MYETFSETKNLPEGRSFWFILPYSARNRNRRYSKLKLKQYTTTAKTFLEINLYSMKIKEQTRKLAAGCT